MKADEPFLTLYCDPGEDFGWCVGHGIKLISGGTTKMWEFTDEVWAALNGNPSILLDPDYTRDGIELPDYVDPEGQPAMPIKRIVAEDFRIYPWVAKAGGLNWDPMRTPRVIGALTFMARVFGIPILFQPAAIKDAAKKAGAEELYWRPLRENRHQNDAIQHYVYYTNTELLGLKMQVPPTSEAQNA